MSTSSFLVRSSLALLGASSIAIALPLFSTLADGVSFFLAHEASGTDIVLFSLIVYLVPPLVLSLAVVIMTAIKPDLGRTVLLIVIALLSCLFALGLVRVLPAFPALAIAVTAAAALTVLYHRNDIYASILRTIAWLSPVALAAFLWFSPISTLLFDASDGEMLDPSSTESIKPYPVVFVLLDELSLTSILDQRSLIDAKRLPNFDRLATLSTWFRNATTVSSLTHTAVPAILSGRYPASKSAPVYQHYPQNLFTMLSGSHKLRVSETVTRLCPSAMCMGGSTTAGSALTEPDTNESQSFTVKLPALLSDSIVVFMHLVTPKKWADQLLPSLSDSWSGFGKASALSEKGEQGEVETDPKLWNLKDMSTNSNQAFTEFGRSLRDIQPQQLHYFHLSLPHHPWTRLADGRRYNGVTDLGRAGTAYAWGASEQLVQQAELRYLMQLEYVDTLLGEMLDALEESPHFDSTLLVVLADHGLAFKANASVRQPTKETLADIARIPLFVKFPGQLSATVDDRPVQTIDLIPTIAELLNIDLTQTVDGISLLEREQVSTSRKLIEYAAKHNVSDFEQALGTIADITHDVPTDVAQGAFQQQVGRNVSDIQFQRQDTIYAAADNPHWYEEVALESQFLPARFTASVHGFQQNADFMVSLNGRIAGSGQSYDEGRRLSILLNPEYFIQGRNKVDLFARLQGNIVHVPQRSNRQEFKLLEDVASKKLNAVGFAGREYVPGLQNGHQGWAKRSSKEAGSISGWAYDFKVHKSAATVLLLRGDTLVSADSRRFGLIPFGGDYENFAPEEKPGYSFEVNDASPDYRVIALFDAGYFLEFEPELQQ